MIDSYNAGIAQSRRCAADGEVPYVWKDRPGLKLEHAAIAEAEEFLIDEADSLSVEVRYSDRPDVIYGPLVVSYKRQYSIKGLRGGDCG